MKSLWAGDAHLWPGPVHLWRSRSRFAWPRGPNETATLPPRALVALALQRPAASAASRPNGRRHGRPLRQNLRPNAKECPARARRRRQTRWTRTRRAEAELYKRSAGHDDDGRELHGSSPPELAQMDEGRARRCVIVLVRRGYSAAVSQAQVVSLSSRWSPGWLQDGDGGTRLARHSRRRHWHETLVCFPVQVLLRRVRVRVRQSARPLE